MINKLKKLYFKHVKSEYTKAHIIMSISEVFPFIMCVMLVKYNMIVGFIMGFISQWLWLIAIDIVTLKFKSDREALELEIRVLKEELKNK